MPGIESMSGSIKQKNGKMMVFKTFRRPSTKRPNGKPETRVYFMSKWQRSTPPSEKELCARIRFTAASTYWMSLTDEQKQQYALEMRRANCKFNGKQYKMLRGYVIARFYAGAVL